MNFEGSMYSYIMYFGLKVVPVQVLGAVVVVVVVVVVLVLVLVMMMMASAEANSLITRSLKP